jgi:hypothetical protein
LILRAFLIVNGKPATLHQKIATVVPVFFNFDNCLKKTHFNRRSCQKRSYGLNHRRI